MAWTAKTQELNDKSYEAYNFTPEQLKAHHDELAEVLAVMPENQKLQKIFADIDKQVKDNESQGNYAANIEVFNVNAILTSTWMNQLNQHYTFKVRNFVLIP